VVRQVSVAGVCGRCSVVVVVCRWCNVVGTPPTKWAGHTQGLHTGHIGHCHTIIHTIAVIGHCPHNITLVVGGVWEQWCGGVGNNTTTTMVV